MRCWKMVFGAQARVMLIKKNFWHEEGRKKLIDKSSKR